jgi:uncharacterized protein YdaU (DUF1376 family)
MATFYKHDIASWMDGTEELSHEAYRALHVIVQLIMLNESPIVLNERGLAGRCNMPTKRFMKAVAELIDARKITLRNGKIWNERAQEELENIQKHRGNSAKGGKISRKPPVSDQEISKNSPNGIRNPLTDNDVPLSALTEGPKEKRREEEKREEEEGEDSPSSTTCLIPHAGPSAEDDRQGTPIGMDDLTGLEGLDQAGDDFAGPNVDPLPVEPGPAQPKRREPKRGTRIPEGWELGEAETAVWTKLGLPASRLQFQWTKFTNHFRGASGPRAIKVDWLATWRNWCLTEFERSPQAAAVFGETGPAKDKWGRPLGALKISGAV